MRVGNDPLTLVAVARPEKLRQVLDQHIRGPAFSPSHVQRVVLRQVVVDAPEHRVGLEEVVVERMDEPKIVRLVDVRGPLVRLRQIVIHHLARHIADSAGRNNLSGERCAVACRIGRRERVLKNLIGRVELREVTLAHGHGSHCRVVEAA